MKMNKTALIVVSVLVVGALATVFIDKSSNKNSDPLVGQNLIEGQNFVKLDRVSINSSNDTVELSKTESGEWVISSAQSFPVDVARLTSLVDNLEKIKIQRLAAKSDKNFESFGLKSPTTLKLGFSGQEKVIELGENRDGGGQYISFGGQKAYLVDNVINANTDPSFWEFKTLANIEGDLVKRVTFHLEGRRSALTASREKKEDNLKLVETFKGQKIRDYQVTNLKSALQNLNFSKRHDKSNELAKTALAKAKTSTIELFDGRRYELKVGFVGKEDKDKKYFASVKKVSDGKDVSKEHQEADQLISRLHDMALFEVGSHTYGKVFKKKDELFEKKVSQKKKTDKKG